MKKLKFAVALIIFTRKVLHQHFKLLNMDNLRLVTIQSSIIWEDKNANIRHYEQNYLSKLKPGSVDLILLPEMFLTGFSMKTDILFEEMNGFAIKKMQKWAEVLNCQIGGSIIIKENGQYFNRFLIVSKTGVETYYDKAHLFRMGDENNHFSKGTKRIIYNLNGWRLLLQVCYDLRFPVFSRNKTINNDTEYDAVIYIANWPKVRSNIWSNLIQARAIENQAYSIGVNRVGLDGNEVNHSGDSMVVNPWGQILYKAYPNQEDIQLTVLKKSELQNIKDKFPAFLDADNFELKL